MARRSLLLSHMASKCWIGAASSGWKLTWRTLGIPQNHPKPERCRVFVGGCFGVYLVWWAILKFQLVFFGDRNPGDQKLHRKNLWLQPYRWWDCGVHAHSICYFNLNLRLGEQKSHSQMAGRKAPELEIYYRLSHTFVHFIEQHLSLLILCRSREDEVNMILIISDVYIWAQYSTPGS